MNLPANGTSVTYSTQSVDALRSDDTELSDPLDAFNEWDIMTSDEHGDKLQSRLFEIRWRDRFEYWIGGGGVGSTLSWNDWRWWRCCCCWWWLNDCFDGCGALWRFSRFSLFNLQSKFQLARTEKSKNNNTTNVLFYSFILRKFVTA